MVKSNELRIGNRVHISNYKDCIITGINKTKIFLNNNPTQLPIEDIAPIPITVEVLEKFGFEIETLHGNGGCYNVARNNPLTFNSIHGWWVYGTQMDFQIKHLHQLQNLYFALTGTELTVNI